MAHSSPLFWSFHKCAPATRPSLPPPPAETILSITLSPAENSSPSQRAQERTQRCHLCVPSMDGQGRHIVDDKVEARAVGRCVGVERTACSRVCHFVPTSSGTEGCSMWKVSRGLTLRCPNLQNMDHFGWALFEVPLCVPGLMGGAALGICTFSGCRKVKRPEELRPPRALSPLGAVGMGSGSFLPETLVLSPEGCAAPSFWCPLGS